jgi:drug/metabolite transporter (DMT)-like permease
MGREELLKLGPDAGLGGGIVGATWLASHGAQTGLWVLGGALAMAVTILVADAWRRRQSGKTLRPSWTGTLLVAGLTLASMIVVSDGHRAMTQAIPMAGMIAWVIVLSPTGRCVNRLASSQEQAGR